MPSLEELKRENAILKARTEVNKDFADRDFEKRKLMKENERMKHPRRFGLLKAAGGFMNRGTTAIGKSLTVKRTTNSKGRRKLKPMKISDWL